MVSECRRAVQLDRALLGTPQQLVGIAQHPGPSQRSDAIDDLGGPWAHQREIASVHNLIDPATRDVIDHGIERGEVAVNIGNDGDAHLLIMTRRF